MQELLNRPYLRFVVYLVRQFVANNGVSSAAALTYTTLFAVVPLMTVSYAFLAAVPSFQGVGEELQAWVFSNFVPATGEVVQTYLGEFSGQARKLTAVGVAFLAITAIMMMKSIENAFNRVWRVAEPRKGMSSFLLYWAVLSLGPVLIGLGLVVSSYIASLSLVSSATELVGKTRLLSLLPMIMSAAAFTLLYAAVPNCRVPLRSAFIGGVAVAMLFETAKRGFAMFVTQFPSYELIYGAFAAVPLFLLWIFISWVMILLGCELTRGITIYNRLNVRDRGEHFGVIMQVVFALWDARREGRALADSDLLATVAGLDQGRWDTYSQLLLGEGIMSRTDSGGYILARDTRELTVNDLYERLPWPLPNSLVAVELGSGWQNDLDLRLKALASA
ncbi:MAG: YihY family inner membrane protein, partial [Pontibacterium sp.]